MEFVEIGDEASIETLLDVLSAKYGRRLIDCMYGTREFEESSSF